MNWRARAPSYPVGANFPLPSVVSSRSTPFRKWGNTSHGFFVELTGVDFLFDGAGRDQAYDLDGAGLADPVLGLLVRR